MSEILLAAPEGSATEKLFRSRAPSEGANEATLLSDLAAVPGALAGRRWSVLLWDAAFNQVDLERTLQETAAAHPEIVRLVIVETSNGSGPEIRGDYQASVTVNYIDGCDREEADDSIDSWTTVDLQLNWNPALLRGGAVALGMDNVFDEEPPEDPFLEGWPFFNRALHDPRGRSFYLRYSQDF